MRWRCGAIAVCVAIVGGFAVRAGALTMESAATYATGTRPVRLASADLNRDGLTDVVALNNVSGTVSVFLGEGSGTLFPAGSTSVVSRPVALAIADVNSDAKPDIITVGSVSGNIVIRLGDGTGRFPNVAKYQTTSSALHALAVGDLNADGKADLVTDAPNGAVRVLLGDGASHFKVAQGSPYSARSAPSALAVARMNGDRWPDVVVASVTRGTVAVLLGSSTGALTLRAERLLGTRPGSITVTDLDTDGANDVAVAEPDAASALVLPGDGTGNLDAGTRIDAPSGTRALALGDANADGSLDLVGVSDTSENMFVGLDDGAGSYVSATGSPYTVDGAPEDVVTVDVDRDGVDDAVIAQTALNSVVVIHNSSARELVVNPPSVDFGTVDAGGSSDPVTVTASSDGLLSTITSVTVDDPNFVIDTDGCTGASVGDGHASCDVELRFAPSDVGDVSAVLSFTSDDGGTISVPLYGSARGTSAPETTITEHPKALTNNMRPTFGFIADQPDATFVCAIDDAEPLPCTSPYTTDRLTEGQHTFSVAAVGQAGDVDLTPASFVVTIDITPPRTTIRGPSRATRANAWFVFRFSETVRSVWCSMDGSRYLRCKTPYRDGVLRPGRHVLRVRAVDVAGNVERRPAVKTFTVTRRHRHRRR